MTVLVFSLIVFLSSAIAGLIGSFTGLGGGVVLIPLLTLLFKVDIHYAIGTSLISVIATSSGAAAAYVKEGITNIRLGMFLELATTIGAITGAIRISPIVRILDLNTSNSSIVLSLSRSNKNFLVSCLSNARNSLLFNSFNSSSIWSFLGFIIGRRLLI